MTITVSEIAKELKMNPKQARTKLRKSALKPTDGKWVFAAKDKKKIVGILAEKPKASAKTTE